MPALSTAKNGVSGGVDLDSAVRMSRRMKWNPLRGFSSEMLARALDGFEAGDLREAAIIWDAIAKRDDTIPGVKGKREKSVAHKRHEVVKLARTPEADRQQEILQGFWNRARWTSAWDRSKQGRLPALVRSMQEAVSYMYAAHHIVWEASTAGLSATFEAVPLWFFEGREGRLRFLPSGHGLAGEELDAKQWLVSTGDGLMFAASIGYAAKRLSMMDWLRFSEMFSVPGVLGKTAAQQGSTEGAAMADAVEAFANGLKAVIYGADGSEALELIQANGNPQAMPMPAMIEMVNRKFAALWRGADLSTMSAGQGDGAGASLQGDEADILERDDAAARSEDLQRVERMVLEYHFGPDVETLAEGRILVPEREDQAALLTAATKFFEMGARLPRTILDRFGLSEADADEEAFERAAGGGAVIGDRLSVISEEEPVIGGEEAAQNARRPELSNAEEIRMAAGELIARARREDMAGLSQRLREILAEGSPALMTMRLQELKRDLPKYLEGTPETDSAWERILWSAISEGWAEEPAGEQ